ncbi:hypothetical protein QZH56_13760 [Streptomyces olivoreticuli]|uniref:hypothetical protein n=1 Tax=Streptomyces olivoreticuli TaxID=68246 RepID=UPI00265A3BCF|nr:hypothetical protein [Streptomyces olivoreticuli]WKK26559.1 hypothetical protein QZH56_13760 [Streptomyces olivoreticuli]
MKLSRPRRPRRAFTDALDVAGLGCLVTAAWWCHPVAGLIVLGLVLLLMGWVMDR